MTRSEPVNLNRKCAPRAFALLLAAAALFTGCVRPPSILAPELRKPIDRGLVERPASLDIERFITSLTAPTAMAFDTQKNALLIAESGTGGKEPCIRGFNLNDGTSFLVYPRGKQLGPFRSNPFRMHGPIGGLAVRDGVVYASHRDGDDMGVISAITYEGKGRTVVAGLPAQGDYGVTDIVFGPDGRLYFGVGAATNSGVVGLDNWQAGWVQKHPKVADKLPKLPSGQPWRLRGPKFFTTNPLNGLFTGSDLAVTAPFQSFNEFTRSRIAGVDKPNAAIYSVQPNGGIATDLRIEAYGIRLPAGLAFNSYQTLFTTAQGMEARGTRPVMDDPDTVLQIYSGPRWYGWPDGSTDLWPITEERFKVPEAQILRTGYTEQILLLDLPGDVATPWNTTDRDNMVRGTMPALSGASKMTFVPSEGPLSEFQRELIVALSGDRAPFAISNSGRKLSGPVGYKLVRIDTDGRNVRDFVKNVSGTPRSQTRGRSSDLLERPIDVKIGPDGFLYVLDFGKLEVKNGKKRVTPRTGQVFRVYPAGMTPTTMPAPAESADKK